MKKITRWSRELCIQAVDSFTLQHGRPPVCKDFYIRDELPSFVTFKKYVGESCTAYCNRKYGVWPAAKRHPRWNRDRCIQAVDDFVSRFGRAPTSQEYTKANGLPNGPLFHKLVGMSGTAHCKEKYGYDPYGRNGREAEWDKERCIKAVDQFVKIHGRAPLSEEYGPQNGLPSVPIFKRKAGISGYVFCREKYGFKSPYKGPPTHWNGERCIQALERFVVTYGRTPRTKECHAGYGLPSPTTFRRAVGETCRHYCRRTYATLDRAGHSTSLSPAPLEPEAVNQGENKTTAMNLQRTVSAE